MHEHHHDHHHDHHGHHHHHHSAQEGITTAFWLNFVFAILELVGGFFINSVSILSDAIHDFGDSVSLGLAWVFEKVAKKKANTHYTFGYRRFSLLGALINSVILLVGSSFVIYESIQRLITYDFANPYEIRTGWMIGFAVLGIIVNGAAVLKTYSTSNLNERVVSLHMMEDVLGWAAVLIVSIVMFFFPNLTFLDPALSIMISIYVIFHACINLWDAMKVFLQKVPEDIDLPHIRKEIEEIDGIDNVHDFHVWSLDNETIIASMHIISSPDVWQIKKKEIKHLMAEHHIEHVTIELESADEECHHCDIEEIEEHHSAHHHHHH
ncbi:MAG: cation transporter [Paludibacteraceae bacterium]|nr:cation transporter [Paludibacteraceae bacterium]